MNEATKTDKLVAALERGQSLTANQIKARFGIQNPSSTADRLRQVHGIPVVSVRARNGVNKYTIGQAPREVIAAGYRALAGVRV